MQDSLECVTEYSLMQEGNSNGCDLETRLRMAEERFADVVHALDIERSAKATEVSDLIARVSRLEAEVCVREKFVAARLSTESQAREALFTRSQEDLSDLAKQVERGLAAGQAAVQRHAEYVEASLKGILQRVDESLNRGAFEVSEVALEGLLRRVDQQLLQGVARYVREAPLMPQGAQSPPQVAQALQAPQIAAPPPKTRSGVAAVMAVSNATPPPPPALGMLRSSTAASAPVLRPLRATSPQPLPADAASAPVATSSASAPAGAPFGHALGARERSGTPRLLARTSRDQVQIMAPGVGSPRQMSPVRVQDPLLQISTAVAKVLAQGGPSSGSRTSLGDRDGFKSSANNVEPMSQAPMLMTAPGGVHAMSPPRPHVVQGANPWPPGATGGRILVGGGAAVGSPAMLHRHTPWPGAGGPQGGHGQSPRSPAPSFAAAGPRPNGMVPFFGQATSAPLVR